MIVCRDLGRLVFFPPISFFAIFAIFHQLASVHACTQYIIIHKTLTHTHTHVYILYRRHCVYTYTCTAPATFRRLVHFYLFPFVSIIINIYIILQYYNVSARDIRNATPPSGRCNTSTKITNNLR